MQKKISLHKLELRNKEEDVNQAFMKMEFIHSLEEHTMEIKGLLAEKKSHGRMKK